MRVPVSWLADYVELEMPLEELASRLSITAAEVEGIERRGVPDTDGNLGRFLVGRVVEADKHPNADRLQLCRVDVGEPEPRQIVCGAWNFGAGATVAVALPGAVLPNGLELERRKVRGELSDGMILAEDEVELGPDHSGIMLLPESEPGTPLGDVLPLRDDVLLVEPTGNRPDLLAVYGLAREVAALYDLELAPFPGREPTCEGDEQVDIEIADLEGCPRYVGRLFREVKVGPSPLWLKARLAAAGMRPISNVVDVTNYVMAALGNPLHAFDFDRLQGGRVIVRRAAAGETLRTLDGVDRTLESGDLVIADAGRAVALAGIMGGEETEIGEETTTVLLEAANFEPTGIFQSSERLRLRTEGSNRWEKGVDPHLAGPAAVLATQLIVETAGARWVGHADVQGDLPGRPRDLLPAAPCRRGHRPRNAARRPARAPRPARLRVAWRGRGGAHLARPRRPSRDRRGRGDRALPDGRRPVHAARAPCDVRRAHPAPAPLAQGRRCARRARARRDVHALAEAGRPRPERLAAARADLGGARRPAHPPAPEPRRRRQPQRRAGRSRVRAVRARARVPAG